LLGTVSVLAVSSENGDHKSLRAIFSHTRWQLFEAHDCQEALNFLQQQPAGVVICESSLPDGTWRTVLDAVPELPGRPLLIVSSWNPDAVLWAEVLNIGAYDVLSKPFDSSEVTRVVSLAWLRWKERTVSTRKAPAVDSGAARAGQVEMRSATA